MSAAFVREFVRPAVRALPSTMVRRLGGCDEHDAVMESLLCFGQALWPKLSDAELRAYWTLLDQEISEGITGEIDEQALEQKHALLAGRRGPVGAAAVDEMPVLRAALQPLPGSWRFL
jgi:hypothetical protein